MLSGGVLPDVFSRFKSRKSGTIFLFSIKSINKNVSPCGPYQIPTNQLPAIGISETISIWSVSVFRMIIFSQYHYQFHSNEALACLILTIFDPSWLFLLLTILLYNFYILEWIDSPLKCCEVTPKVKSLYLGCSIFQDININFIEMKL